MPDNNKVRRCKMCGKFRPIKFFRTWLFKGVLYKGCKFCRLNMIKELNNEYKNEKEDDIL